MFRIEKLSVLFGPFRVIQFESGFYCPYYIINKSTLFFYRFIKNFTKNTKKTANNTHKTRSYLVCMLFICVSQAFSAICRFVSIASSLVITTSVWHSAGKESFTATIDCWTSLNAVCTGVFLLHPHNTSVPTAKSTNNLVVFI